MNPLADQPLRTRGDFQAAVVRLYEPLLNHVSPGSARVIPGETGQHFPDVAAATEGFARPLWGLAPLAAGGGAFDHWDLFREGLANGTDPDHPEYWGQAGDYDQQHVEMAAVGVALALAPGELWEPLDDETKANVAATLNRTTDAALYDSNWLFFRVLATLGLRAVGAEHDWAATQDALDRLESFSVGDGWYADGPPDESPRDYYVPWEMHADGLIYAALAGEDDPERAARFRERAGEFAAQYRHWFRADGEALPMGRSLTYRFAQSAFWGALAFADVEALPWGELRGLWARNVRWWADQPIFAADGVLTIGYRYPTLKASEGYNSPSSPYWAMKAFLPLALPADHPFWRAEERPLTGTTARTVQPEPKLIVCRDADAGHHYALAAGQNSHSLEKYTKFAYSTDFGFSVRSRAPGLAGAGHDSALALSEDGTHYRIRLSVAETAVDGETLYARWEPWDDVTVDTWLAPASPWHVRIHRVDAGRPLSSGEGGFPIDRSGDDDPDAAERREEAGSARVRYPAGTSGIRDLAGERRGRAVDQDPNTNVVFPRTVVPTLEAVHDPGTHWLTSAVTAATAGHDDAWERPPRVEADGDVAALSDADGATILRCDAEAPGPLGEYPVP